MSEVPFDPEMKTFEADLRALVPSRSGLERDRLMFRAGWISARRQAGGGWLWPALAAGLALVVVSESFLLAVRPPHRVVERVVTVRENPPSPEPPRPEPVVILSQAPTAPPAEPESLSPEAAEYLRLQRQVQRYGLEGLPEPPPLLTRTGEVSLLSAPESAGALLNREREMAFKRGGPS